VKYGVTEQLRAQDVDAAQRFHVAMLQRLHELQLGARPDLGQPVDVALTMMALWAKRNPAGVSPPAQHPV
jgi:hypothetical protein